MVADVTQEQPNLEESGRLLALHSFIVPPNEFADRCAVTLTLLLTSVAFKLVIAEKLPSISYLTLADKYVLGSVGLVIFIVIADMISALLCWNQSDAPEEWPTEQPAKRRDSLLFDQISSLVLFCLWILFHILFFLGARRALHRSGRQMLLLPTPSVWTHRMLMTDMAHETPIDRLVQINKFRMSKARVTDVSNVQQEGSTPLEAQEPAFYEFTDDEGQVQQNKTIWEMVHEERASMSCFRIPGTTIRF